MVIGDKEYDFHLLPSGIIHQGCKNVLGMLSYFTLFTTHKKVVSFLVECRCYLSINSVRAIPFKKLPGGVSALNFLDHPAATS